MASLPTMTAVVSDGYGPPEVLRVCQVPMPSPRPDEVRVRIIASAVTASDIFIRSAHVSARLQVPFRLMMGVMDATARFHGGRRAVLHLGWGSACRDVGASGHVCLLASS